MLKALEVFGARYYFENSFVCDCVSWKTITIKLVSTITCIWLFQLSFDWSNKYIHWIVVSLSVRCCRLINSIIRLLGRCCIVCAPSCHRNAWFEKRNNNHSSYFYNLYVFAGRLCRKLHIGDYASRIVHSLSRVLVRFINCFCFCQFFSTSKHRTIRRWLVFTSLCWKHW